MSRYIIALDCSFTRTGIAILDTTEKKLYFETASEKIGEKQFENVFHAAKSIVNQLKTIFEHYGDDYDLIMEAPLPISSMSAALYSLDTLIYNEFESHVKATFNPATLRSKIHGHKYEKKDSQNLANKYINILSNSMYKILSVMGTKRKICHDCCEAFLYLHLYLKMQGHKDFQFDNSQEIAAYKQRMKQLKAQEKLLLKEEQNNERI